MLDNLLQGKSMPAFSYRLALKVLLIIAFFCVGIVAVLNFFFLDRIAAPRVDQIRETAATTTIVLSDLAQAGFVANNPEQLQDALDKLIKESRSLDSGWLQISLILFPSGYYQATTTQEFRNKRVGESLLKKIEQHSGPETASELLNYEMGQRTITVLQFLRNVTLIQEGEPKRVAVVQLLYDYNRLMNQTRQWLLLAGVSVLLLLVVVVLSIFLVISAVYRRLHEGLNQISRENFAYRLPLFSGDETGILFSAFNQTAARLQKQTKEKTVEAGVEKTDTKNRSSSPGEQLLRKTDITCLVARIPGIQKQIGAAGPEAVEEYISAFIQPLDKVVREYGGQVAEILGDKVYAFFEGINCVDNGIRAALKLMQYWQTVNHERKVLGRSRYHYGIGLHETESIAGTVGRSFSHYTFIGQAAALAAYLCSRAGSEQIWTSSTMMDKTSGAYPCRVRPEIDLADISPDDNVLEINPSAMAETTMASPAGGQPEPFRDGRNNGANALSETFGFTDHNRSSFEPSITDMLEETLVTSPLEPLKSEEEDETGRERGKTTAKKSLWEDFDTQEGSAKD